MQELLRQLEAVAQPTVAKGRAGLAERNQDFHRLLGREKLVSQLGYLDASGSEQCAARHRSRSTGSTAGSISRGARRSSRARAAKRYFGPVYFQRGSQPHMTISVAEPAPEAASWSPRSTSRSVRQVIERARIGTAGYAYAVDSRGELIDPPGHQPRPPAHELRVASAGASRAARADRGPDDSVDASGAIRTGRRC